MSIRANIWSCAPRVCYNTCEHVSVCTHVGTRVCTQVVRSGHDEDDDAESPRTFWPGTSLKEALWSVGRWVRAEAAKTREGILISLLFLHTATDLHTVHFSHILHTFARCAYAVCSVSYDAVRLLVLL